MGEQTKLTVNFHCCELPMNHLIHLLEETGSLGTANPGSYRNVCAWNSSQKCNQGKN